jgi:GAF domain-containing protein
LSEKHKAVIKEVERIVSEGKEHDPIYQEICELLRKGFNHYTWVGIYIVEGDHLILKAWVGDHETEHTKIKVGEGICGLAADTGKTVVVPDVSKDFRYIMCFAATKSEIVVPIKKGNTVYGEIDIDSDELDAFDKDDELLLEEVANVISKIY